MTTHDDQSDPWQPGLPGLTPDLAPAGRLTKAARATLDSLTEQGLLEDRHALHVQAILQLAEQLDRETRGKLTVAVGTGWRTLLDMIEQLPQPTAAHSDAWDDMARAFAEADARARADAAAARAGDR